jgi:acetate---CoA ligase (ADP-forming)
MTSQRISSDLLFRPRSIAVIGASNDVNKWGYRLAANILPGAAHYEVYLITRDGQPVQGRASYAGLSALAVVPDMAAIAVPPKAVEAEVRACCAAGVKVIVVITSGLGLGDTEVERWAELTALTRSSGAMLIGPNCNGIGTPALGFNLTWDAPPSGSIGMLSQSGSVIYDTGFALAELGQGYSSFVSTGNQVDVGVEDLFNAMVDDPATRVIGCYIESFRDGRKFALNAERARRLGKPVVLLTIGQTSVGKQAAASHTGALVGDSGAMEAACHAAGVHRVFTPLQFAQKLTALAAVPRMGKRLAVIGSSGGHAGVAADLAAASGFTVAPFEPALAAIIAAAAPTASFQNNPIDLGYAADDPAAVEKVIIAAMTGPDLDGVFLAGTFGHLSSMSPDMAAAECRIADTIISLHNSTKRPLFVHSCHPEAPSVALLRSAGVPIYRDAAQSVAAMCAAAFDALDPPLGVPALVPQSHDVKPPQDAREDYWMSRQFAADAGITLAEAVRCATAAQAAEAARQLGGHVVLKAIGLLHKSDAGGVLLNVEPDQVETKAQDLIDRLHPSSLSVERMTRLDGAVEMIIGTVQDAQFGPMALIGFGGVFVEVLGDTVLILAPASVAQVLEALKKLRGYPLLTGARGRAPVNLNALAETVVALSLHVARHTGIEAFEINPLLVGQHAIALDARLVRLSSSHTEGASHGAHA